VRLDVGPLLGASQSGVMTGVAARDRPLAGKVRGGIAMTTETEVVKARFHSHPNRRAAAAMTADA